MEEKFLYHIWDAGHLLTPLKTVSGKTLQVSYQGQYNTNRGPDFRNVIVSLDGEILRGDVEIHINSYDWNAHEHHEDPHFNNVILHVVMNAGKQQITIKQNGETAEILELKDQLSEDIRKLLESPLVPSGEDRSTYCELLSAIDNDRLLSILANWGLRRFKNKVRRFNASLLLSDFDQVFYEGVMEALGYDKNKQNMLSLAQTVHLKSIRSWQEQGMTPLELVAIFCCASGLLDKSQNRLEGSLLELLRQTYERQKFYARKLDLPWQLFRIRPGNHPIYRIFAMGSLIARTSEQSFLNYFLDQFETGSFQGGKSRSSFARSFAQSTLPGAEKLPKLGQGLISSIFVNIFLPISYMYYDKHGDAASQQRVMAVYADFPALQENHITRFMGRYMSATHSKLANSKTIYQQGLIEIFHRFCHYHLCAECVNSITEEAPRP
ncbi:MAG: DUF2851 family protein [Candidatus Syntrophosphaera sp.]|nr:DUF2851 family protein [Candidatus Syntrophosphaera sp.]